MSAGLKTYLCPVELGFYVTERCRESILPSVGSSMAYSLIRFIRNHKMRAGGFQMNQELTGKFIAQVRKEKNLTQKELADRLGISDKTVSKWETGNGMPDVSLLQPLCRELSVNLNELLSGEKLSEESYNGKAEENMMDLAKDVQEGRENKKKVGIIGLICGILLFLLCLEFTLISVGGVGGIVGFIDFPTLIMLVGFTLGIELIAGRIKKIFKALGAALKNNGTLDDNTRTEYLRDLKFAIRSIILSSVLTALIGLITMLHNLLDPSRIGPNFAVMLIVFFYASVIVAIVFALRERLKA